MRTNLDFSPFYRSSIGFDRLFDLLSEPGMMQGTGLEPAYDIVRVDQDTYCINMAVPGMTEKDVSISYQPNVLTVSAKKAAEDRQDYLYRGIRTGAFNRRFQLADYVEVAGANLVDGVLSIQLKRELPEAIKPRRIPVRASDGVGRQQAPQQIEQARQAA
jgi:molecular chaperone IbpA